MMNFTGSNFVGRGFGLYFTRQEDGWLTASYTFEADKQGPPGIVHGGALAAVLDEAMTAAVFAAGEPALTVNLTIDYRAAVLVGVPISIMGKVDRIERRKLYMLAQILLADGTLAVDAKALFIMRKEAHPD
jgi:acyl-coenzyme A thioesterase PaaI-like protein